MRRRRTLWASSCLLAVCSSVNPIPLSVLINELLGYGLTNRPEDQTRRKVSKNHLIFWTLGSPPQTCHPLTNATLDHHHWAAVVQHNYQVMVQPKLNHSWSILILVLMLFFTACWIGFFLSLGEGKKRLMELDIHIYSWFCPSRSQNTECRCWLYQSVWDSESIWAGTRSQTLFMIISSRLTSF